MSQKLDRLWAPWRLAYIKGKKTGGCPFCSLPRSAPSDKNLVLWKNNDFFVVMNKFPYNPAHLLVIPRAHVASPENLTPELWQTLSLGVRACVSVLKKAYAPHGFNIGMNLGQAGGAGIPKHLHWHILPRWTGDTNFMPLLGETKALPTHNETVYRQLKPHFRDFEKKLATVKLKRK